jgi:hypothetical protein
MLQILVWGICVMIIALGYIAKSAYTLTLPIEKREKGTGSGIFMVFLLIAILIFALTFVQGQEIQSLLGR